MRILDAQSTPPPYSTSMLLDKLDCVAHGFFGSQGGYSSGIYSSLNCGFASHDKPELVAGNRGLVAASFGLDETALYSLQQAHTAKVVHITPQSPAQFNTQADGMVCQHAGIALGALGADCASVLFVDPLNRVIGAAHSGWKGALSGINEAVIQYMCALGAKRENIHAAIGPAMQLAQYEVQADFQALVLQQSVINAQAFFQADSHQIRFDTTGYIQARLRAAGVEQIDQSCDDTYTQRDKYFSYRRACHSKEVDYGRQISVISLTA